MVQRRQNKSLCERAVPLSVAPAKQREVAALAYKFWVARAFHNGSPQEDWLRAMRVVSSQRMRA